MAEQFPPLSAATLAAANVSAHAGAGRSGDAARAAAGGRGSAGRQRRDPNHRRRLPSGGGAGGPAADQRRRGTFYGLSLRGGAPDPRYRTLPVDGRPEAHVLADIAHDYWHIPIRGWWWRTSQPTAVRTPVLPGPRWRAGARPSSRDRHSGPDYAAANHGYLRPRLAGATTPPQWLSFPGCSPVLEQTDGQLGFAGGGAGLWPVTRYRAAAGRAAAPAGYPEGYGPRGKDFISHVTFPPEIRDAATAAGGRPACRGAAGPHPRLKMPVYGRFVANGQFVLLKCNLKRAFLARFMNQLTELRQCAAEQRLIRPIFNKNHLLNTNAPQEQP